MEKFYILTVSIVPIDRERKQVVSVTGTTKEQNNFKIFEQALSEAKSRLSEYNIRYGRQCSGYVIDFFDVFDVVD